MNKRIIYGIIVGLLLLIIIFIRVYGIREQDWSMNFSRYSKDPYGNFLLYYFMKTLFPERDITTLHDPIYTVLKDKNYKRHNYILINDTCILDELDTRELIEFVSQGNNAFIAAHTIMDMRDPLLAVELGIELARYSELISSMRVRFVNPGLGDMEYTLKRGAGAYYFSIFGTKGTTILSVNERNDPVYIRIKYGKGFFYLSSLPLAFTNYSIVSPESRYPFTALSYLPVFNTLWDEYYKIGRLEVRTPLRFILREPSLLWAYIFALVITAVIIINGAKRKQRIIQVIPQVTNTTVDFISTVGRLYYQNKDHRNLAEKKIAHFFEFIRTRLYLDTHELNNKLYSKLASKTGVAYGEVQRIFSLIKSIWEKEHITGNELVALNTGIDALYFKSRSRTRQLK